MFSLCRVVSRSNWSMLLHGLYHTWRERHRNGRMNLSVFPHTSNWFHLASFTFALMATASGRFLSAQCTLKWAQPRVLQVSDGRAAYVEAPTAVATRSGILMLGTPAFIWATPDVFDPAPGPTPQDTTTYLARLRGNHGLAGFVLDSKRRATPIKPPLTPAMRRTLAASGSDGTVHVIGFAPSADATDPDVNGSVWYVERRGEQWTAPTMVFSADRLDWSEHKAAVILTGASDVHIVVPYYRGRTGGIAYIRRTNGRWRVTETPMGGLPSQATAQFIGGDSLVVAFAGIGKAGVRTPNGQHIYLVRVAQADTIWPAPTLIHWSGQNGVRWLGMYGGQGNDAAPRALTLVWTALLKDHGTLGDSVYAIASGDGGATWGQPHVLALPYGVASLTHDRDARGNVHVFLSYSARSDANNSQMYHAAAVNGQWTGLDSLPTGPIASTPTVSSIGPDTMLLAWGNARQADRSSPGAIAPVTEYTTLSTKCSGG